MKIDKIILENFRGYKKRTEISFDDLTVFIGKNDVGKSTILQALDIFFNDKDASVKLDENDFNVFSGKDDEKEIIISVEFKDLPSEIIIDTTNKTTLEDEYLLTEEGKLRIIKKSTDGKKINTYIEAYHPISDECKDLLFKKNADLKKIVDTEKIDVPNKTVNALMRKAIWEHYNAKNKRENVLLDINKKDGDIKSIWDCLLDYLPIYSLFQSDRKNDDNDSEVQDPLKEAVKFIMKDDAIKKELDDVATKVKDKLQEVSNNTLLKLKDMDDKIADELHPDIPTTESLKWVDIFKNVSIKDNNDIPINKRGSGVKRLVLINFFRAEAESKLLNNTKGGIIYAIEEPETSQHIDNQKILIDAFKKMIEDNQNIQIIITTHSGFIVKQFDSERLRMIVKNDNEVNVKKIEKGLLPYVSLNEINYNTFGEIGVDYFNELYGFINIDNDAIYEEYKKGKLTFNYIQLNSKNSNQTPKQYIKTKIIRNQIHHPENKCNDSYTQEELKLAIEEMRKYIVDNNLLAGE